LLNEAIASTLLLALVLVGTGIFLVNRPPAAGLEREPADLGI